MVSRTVRANKSLEQMITRSITDGVCIVCAGDIHLVSVHTIPFVSKGGQDPSLNKWPGSVSSDTILNIHRQVWRKQVPSNLSRTP